MLGRLGLALLFVGWASVVWSQGAEQGSVPEGGEAPQVTLVVSPVLLVDLDALYAGTLFGQRILAEYAAADAIVNAQDAEVVSSLEAQEMDLAARRPDMDVDAFRAEAEAFDAQVQQIREERDAERTQVQRILTEGRAEFDQAIQPILARILIDRGAAVILQKDAVYISLQAIDITEPGIEAFDAIVGDGTQ